MDSKSLTARQRDDFASRSAARMHWLERVIERMQRLGFSRVDPVYMATVKAHTAMRELVETVRAIDDLPAWQRAMGGL
jgi:hypothetical protein